LNKNLIIKALQNYVDRGLFEGSLWVQYQQHFVNKGNLRQNYAKAFPGAVSERLRLV
jgi:hypothetical protein